MKTPMSDDEIVMLTMGLRCSEVKRRLEAISLARQSERKRILDLIEDNCYSYDGELGDGNPKMHRILLGERTNSWINYDKLIAQIKSKASKEKQ